MTGRRSSPATPPSRQTVEGLVDFTIDHYGQLDIMVLNSGGVLPTAPVAQMTDEEWKLEVDWNLNHVFWGMRRALQHMIPRQSGRILVTSSVEGKLGKPGIPGYVACKHAVNGLVKAAAHEVGTLGITVNALLPGHHRDRHRARDRAGLGDRDGRRHVRQDDRAVHPGVGDQAPQHGRGGGRRRRAAGLGRGPEHHRVPVPDRRRDDALLMDGMIVIAGWIDVDPAERDELVVASVGFQRSTRDDEPGCLAYLFAADPAVDGRIQVYEQWATAADLDAHFQHPNFHAMGDLLRSRRRLGGETMKIHVDRTGRSAIPTARRRPRTGRNDRGRLLPRRVGARPRAVRRLRRVARTVPTARRSRPRPAVLRAQSLPRRRRRAQGAGAVAEP